MDDKAKLKLSHAWTYIEEKYNEINQLTQVIRDIEKDKVLAFESGLILSQRHAYSFDGWDRIDWTKFQVPSNVQLPVLDYFL